MYNLNRYSQGRMLTSLSVSRLLSGKTYSSPWIQLRHSSKMAVEIQGKKVGKIGFGMLGLTMRAAPPPIEDAIPVLRAAVESGCTYFNGGDFYGTPTHNSLTLLRAYYERHPEDAAKILLNVKGAVRPGIVPDTSPAYVRESIQACLDMLGPVGTIDQFECARKSKKDVPYEDSLAAIEEFVKEGKIGAVALSEVGAKTVRDAAAAGVVAKIAAVEVELSLWCTEPLTNGVLDACAELGIPVVAYAPLGRGFLTGQIKSFDDIPKQDFRRMLPRFQPANFEHNIRLVREIERLAAKKGCTASQLAINWVVALNNRPGMPLIIPIPGASSVARVKENATLIDLTDAEMKEIGDVLEEFTPLGDRYHKHGMEMLDTQ